MAQLVLRWKGAKSNKARVMRVAMASAMLAVSILGTNSAAQEISPDLARIDAPTPAPFSEVAALSLNCQAQISYRMEPSAPVASELMTVAVDTDVLSQRVLLLGLDDLYLEYLRDDLTEPGRTWQWIARPTTAGTYQMVFVDVTRGECAMIDFGVSELSLDGPTLADASEVSPPASIGTSTRTATPTLRPSSSNNENDNESAATSSTTTRTPTLTRTPTSSRTPSVTRTPDSSEPDVQQPTRTASLTHTPSPTRTPTVTRTLDSSEAEEQPTRTPSPTHTPSPMRTSTLTRTPEPTEAPESTRTPTPTRTRTPTPTRVPAPEVTGISPSAAICGNSQTIRGRGFGNDRDELDGRVTIAERTPGSYEKWTDTEIKFIVPLDVSPGLEQNLQVSTRGGSSGTSLRVSC